MSVFTRCLPSLRLYKQAAAGTAPPGFIAAAFSTSLPAMGPVEDSIRRKITEALSPVELEVINDSPKHFGHSGVAGDTSGETHFRVHVVSEAFEGLNLVKRHQMVYRLLDDELKAGLHALGLKTKTPKEQTP